jgi:hypothetical protein
LNHRGALRAVEAYVHGVVVIEDANARELAGVSPIVGHLLPERRRHGRELPHGIIQLAVEDRWARDPGRAQMGSGWERHEG